MRRIRAKLHRTIRTLTFTCCIAAGCAAPDTGSGLAVNGGVAPAQPDSADGQGILSPDAPDGAPAADGGPPDTAPAGADTASQADSVDDAQADTSDAGAAADGDVGGSGPHGAAPDVAAPECAADGDCAPGGPCTAVTCDGGWCVSQPVSGPCDDGDACTVDDVCAAGACQPGAPLSCHDGNLCTADSCADGACQHAPVAGPCSDADPCTVGDTCADGACQPGPPLECTDGDPCTADACQAGACTHAALQGPCDDGDPCTVSDACGPGGCAGLPKPCDDGNVCTTDSCAPGGDCAHAPAGGPCSDLDDCTTGDHCNDGACAGTPKSCDDGNVCTADSCAAGVCQHAPKGGTCNDGDPCTANDACVAGACTGSALSCDDADDCTADSCLAGACQNVPIPGCPDDMVQIPPGVFWMGCNALVDASCKTDELPQHEVTLGGYEIDRLEATVADYAGCVEAGACSPPGTQYPSCTWNKAGKENHPANCVTWAQAKEFCAWAGKRLCTEAEWERAARGGCEKYPDQACAQAMPKYPWGNAEPTCSYAFYTGDPPDCSDNTTTAEVGTRPIGSSPYGALDMAGNVWDWVADLYGATYYAASATTNPTGPASGTHAVARGGSFYNCGATKIRASIRQPVGLTFSAGDIGFRCCRSLP